MKTNSRQQIDGIFLLHKDTGVSSNRALQQVKRLYNANKAGHTGSLDPLATGVLPICLGEATKFSGYLLAATKAYRVRAKLGIATDTLDCEGKVIATSDVALPNDLEPILEQFRGNIEQIPPMYSALKHNGKKLYELARAGEEVERKRRQVHIYKLDLIDCSANSIELDVVCSKCTYIRTLIDDLGRFTGCLAHVVMLERYQVADFALSSSYTISDLQEKITSGADPLQLLLPVDVAVQHLPRIQLNSAEVERLYHGKQLDLTNHNLDTSFELLRAYDSDNAFIGLLSIYNGILKVKRLLRCNS